MRIEFTINNSSDAKARYLSWTASALRLRLLDAPASGPPVSVTLSGKRNGSKAGSVEFSTTETGTFASTLKVAVPVGGQTVQVFVRGTFGKPSLDDGDVSITAKAGQASLGSLPVMVRVRKDANTLSAAERDRFVSALAQLNDRGLGRFKDFRLMHVSGAADDQAHGGPGFLPWHRAYLLDLERELQAIDSAVSLPYWRFDRKAPRLFTPDFIGVPDSNGNVQFAAGNPLGFWATDGFQGVVRTQADFAPDPATQASPFVATEASTLALGATYKAFRSMQGNPHGRAHTQYFSGFISSIPTAAKDPLFFLLHCNVDRLWAKWQAQFKRFDRSVAAAYDSGPTPTSHLAGHNLNDSLWPWNGIVTPPRPNTAPGGQLAGSVCVTAPGGSPLVADMLDYQGKITSGAKLGFSYDDVQVV